MINSNTLIFVGMIIIFIGIIILIIGTVLQGSSQTNDDQQGSQTSTVKTGGVVLIGPIPIIFGSDKSTIITSVILAIILMVLAYLLFYRGLKIF